MSGGMGWGSVGGDQMGQQPYFFMSRVSDSDSEAERCPELVAVLGG